VEKNVAFEHWQQVQKWANKAKSQENNQNKQENSKNAFTKNE